ncbi:shikimate dehydrogenase [Flavobacteriaceae bacterium]|nr:shikimate dehydrogenase [Flavobacteriaceae bacterium]MDC3330029.1 shikimate dehydrogenase [Flavobacteriaceae bacterium]
MTKKERVKQFGLVGKNIDYSFSRTYFRDKFERENKVGYRYANFDLQSIENIREVFNSGATPSGLNVTIPYKKAVIPYLDQLTEEAKTIQAVNTIVIEASGKTIGHNTDHVGFQKALLERIEKKPKQALILGTGGASGAVHYVLDQIQCSFQFVSRTPQKGQLAYADLTKELFETIDLIVNTTPLGTFPNVEEAPPIPYEYLGSRHFLFDLIYNPEESKFLKEGRSRGAQTCNGYKMLVYQAEKSWELWNQ